MTKQTESLIQQLTTTSDAVLVQSLYRQWAETYDSDLSDFGYVAPRLSVDTFSQLLPNRQALIYDAGCGTGLIGKLLQTEGYDRIHGADFSPEMLEHARLTGAYLQLELADYSASISAPSAYYDAVISVGVYTARFEQKFILEMLRILKPGGLMHFTCRPHYFESDAGSELQQLLLDKKISSLHVERKPYMLKENADAFYITLTATADYTP